MAKNTYNPNWREDLEREWKPWTDGKLDDKERLVFNIIAVFLLILFGYFLGYLTFAVDADHRLDYLSGVFSDVLNILSTVVLVTLIQQYFAREQRKKDLVRKAGSRVRGVALDAMDDLMHEGWATGPDSLLQNKFYRYVDWSGAILNEINLSSTTITFDADLSQIKARHTVLISCNFDQVKLTGAFLRATDCTKATFTNCNFADCWLVEAVFKEASVRHCDLSNVNLTLASFQGADLTGTNLKNARLTTRDIVNVDRKTVIFDEDTILPNGLKWIPKRGRGFEYMAEQFGCIVDVD